MKLVKTQNNNSNDRAAFTDEVFIVKAIGYDENGERITEYGERTVKEGQDPAEALESANKYAGWLRKQGFTHTFVTHGFTMHWDREQQKVVDSDLLERTLAASASS